MTYRTRAASRQKFSSWRIKEGTELNWIESKKEPGTEQSVSGQLRFCSRQRYESSYLQALYQMALDDLYAA
jgi:hypothetical protein